MEYIRYKQSIIWKEAKKERALALIKKEIEKQF